MKQIISIAVAVVLLATAIAGLTATPAGAQGSSSEYAPSIPQHEGLNPDGSVSLDFSGTGFAPNQTIIVTVGGLQVAVAIDADYQGTYPAAGPSLAGESVTFIGQVEDFPNGPALATASKSFPAVVEPTAIPTVVFVVTPTPVPVDTPTAVPVVTPTEIPTVVLGAPTPEPTAEPTTEPTVQPAAAPSAPQVVVVQKAVAGPTPGNPATAMNTATITTPRNLPAESAAPRSPSVPLALTGNETSVPIMVGSGLVLVGGLAVLASRRRNETI